MRKLERIEKLETKVENLDQYFTDIEKLLNSLLHHFNLEAFKVPCSPPHYLLKDNSSKKEEKNGQD